MNIFYVYVLFRPWDGSPFYVGKGQGNRWLRHGRYRHPNKYLFNLIGKANRLGLEIPRIKVRSNLQEHEAFQIERALIAAIGRGKKGPLVNMTDGGEGASGTYWSPEARAKLSAAAMGNKRSLGIKRSSEVIEKLKARRHSPQSIAKMSAAHKGKKLTAEHRDKLRAAKIGKPLSFAHRTKIRLANLGKKRSDETKENMRRSMRRDPISGRWVRSVNADDRDINGVSVLRRIQNDWLVL